VTAFGDQAPLDPYVAWAFLAMVAAWAGSSTAAATWEAIHRWIRRRRGPIQMVSYRPKSPYEPERWSDPLDYVPADWCDLPDDDDGDDD
jgi:hypothetical protein